MAPNLISHHLRVLREAGLVTVQKSAEDSRWVYYSLNEGVLRELNSDFGAFFQPERIKPRRAGRSPQAAFVPLEQVGQGTTDHS
jgi:ArsR family transcriptional regulator